MIGFMVKFVGVSLCSILMYLFTAPVLAKLVTFGHGLAAIAAMTLFFVLARATVGK